MQSYRPLHPSSHRYERMSLKESQVCGGAGVSGDLDLAYLYALARPLRIADGPDAVRNPG